MRSRWVLGLALAAAGACSGDGFSFDEGSVRGLAIVGTSPDLALVEYGAPPLRERRRRALTDAAGNLQVLVTDQTRGGFVAVRWAAAIASWSLERYGPDWTVVASRPGTSIAGPDTILAIARFTPDGQFLVAELAALSGGVVNVVLDAVTLAPLRRVPHDGRGLFLGSGPTAAEPTQLLLTAPVSCSRPVIWLDASTGFAADSASCPAGRFFRGALTHRRLYLLDNPVPRLVLWNVDTGAEMASYDSLVPQVILADAARGRLVGVVPGVVLRFDPQTLVLRDSVWTGVQPAPRTIQTAVIDPATGALFATTYQPVACQTCFPTVDGVVVVDLAKRRVAVHEILALPVSLVP